MVPRPPSTPPSPLGAIMPLRVLGDGKNGLDSGLPGPHSPFTHLVCLSVLSAMGEHT